VFCISVGNGREFSPSRKMIGKFEFQFWIIDIYGAREINGSSLLEFNCRTRMLMAHLIIMLRLIKVRAG